MRRFALRALVSGATLAVTALAVPAPAHAPTGRSADAAPRPQQSVEHRAAVVVDTGSGVRYGCVRFTADSISAKEALEQAAMDPVFQEFGGNLGSAVCALCGTGCPVGSCLTCAAQVWSYWRQPAGSGGYTLSGAGVSNVAVHDGDIEGWVWGRTGPPPGISIENVCGPESPPPAPGPDDGGGGGAIAADPGTVPGPTGGDAGSGDPLAGPVEPGPGQPGEASATAEEAPAGAEGKRAKKDEGKGRHNDEELTAAAAADDDDGGGGPPASLLALLALLAALGGAVLWLRHVRSRAGPVESP